MRQRPGRSDENGQIIVIFAMALVAIVAMAALVIEAGNAFAQQRVAQNGADAVANAGVIQIAQDLAGSAKTGDDVFNAVTAAATANELANPVAVYTNNFGDPLSPEVVVALGTDIPTGARGVKVVGDRISGTTLAGLIGIHELKASAEATAIAGAASGGCPEDTTCGFLPVTFPVQISVCDGSGQLTGIGEPGDLWDVVEPPFTPETESIVPLCKTAPGAVGWLDLQPGENLAGEIVNPLSDFDYPTWVQTQPGNPNSVEDEINDNYSGKVVSIPMFDGVCRYDPSPGDCPPADSSVDPVGNNTWYHIPYIASFLVDEAITQGANVDDCNNHNPLAEPQLIATTPEFLGCLTGWFVDFILPGEVDPNTPINPETTIGIQLIK